MARILSPLIPGGPFSLTDVAHIGNAASLSYATTYANDFGHLREILAAGTQAKTVILRQHSSPGYGGGVFDIMPRGESDIDDDGIVALGGVQKATRQLQTPEVPAECWGYPVTTESLQKALAYANSLTVAQLTSEAFAGATQQQYVTSRRCRPVSLSTTTAPLDTIHVRWLLDSIVGKSSGATSRDAGGTLLFKDSAAGIVYHNLIGLNWIVSRLNLKGLRITRVGAVAATEGIDGIQITGNSWFAGSDWTDCHILGFYRGLAFASDYQVGYAGYLRMINCTVSQCVDWGVYGPGILLDDSVIDSTVVQNGAGGINIGMRAGTIIRGDAEANPEPWRLTVASSDVASAYHEGSLLAKPLVELAGSNDARIGPQFFVQPGRTLVVSAEGHNLTVDDPYPARCLGTANTSCRGGWRIPQANSEGLCVALDAVTQPYLRRLDSVPSLVSSGVYTDGTFLDTIRVGSQYLSAKYLGDNATPTQLTWSVTHTAGQSILLAFVLLRSTSTDGGTLSIKVETYESSVWVDQGTRTVTLAGPGCSQVVASVRPSSTATQIRLTVNPYAGSGTATGASMTGVVYGALPDGIYGVPQFAVEALFDDSIADWRLAQKQLLRYSPSVLWLPPRTAGVEYLEGAGSSIATWLDASGNGYHGTSSGAPSIATIDGIRSVVLNASGGLGLTDSLPSDGAAKWTRAIVCRDRSGAGGEAPWFAQGADASVMATNFYSAGAASAAVAFTSTGNYRIFTAPGGHLDLLVQVYDGTLAGAERLKVYRRKVSSNGATGGVFPSTLPTTTGTTWGNGAANVDLAFRFDAIGYAPQGTELSTLVDTTIRATGLTP